MTLRDGNRLRKGDIVTHGQHPGIYYCIMDGRLRMNSMGDVPSIPIAECDRHGFVRYTKESTWLGYISWLTLMRRAYEARVMLPDGV